MIASQKNATAWPLPWSTQEYVDRVKAMLPRCLTIDERKAAGLEEEPPVWCIEMAKWPYDSADWQQWLEGRKAGKEAPLPTIQ
jgi:hypothetical protein